MHLVTTVSRRRELRPSGGPVAELDRRRRTAPLVLTAALVAATFAIALLTTTSPTDVPGHGPPTWQEIAGGG